MSRVLLLGANGQLGFRLAEQLGDTCIALDRAACDVTTLDAKKIHVLIEAHQPTHLINATGYTQVDAAETNRASAMQVNAAAPLLLAQVAQARGIGFTHFSTDYVFDGKRGAPYAETAATHPANHYGASKRAGEEGVLEAGGTVFRLQWLYDVRGRNFFCTLRRLLAEGKPLRIVADQLGAPSFAPDVAACVMQALQQNIPAGLYHLTAQGHTSWHGFACAIAAGTEAHIEPITSAEYLLPAPRPLDARLNCGALASYGITMPHWREGLARAMEMLA
ncbi:MAG: dTDP-4-dehydrorhamnose reductase [Rickettsiales bacterium]